MELIKVFTKQGLIIHCSAGMMEENNKIEGFITIHGVLEVESIDENNGADIIRDTLIQSGLLTMFINKEDICYIVPYCC